MKCQSCGSEVRPGQAFCPNCGEKVADTYCVECGKPVNSGIKICPYCGKSTSKNISESLGNPKTPKKKGGCLKHILIAIGGLIAICIFFAAIAPDNEKAEDHTKIAAKESQSTPNKDVQTFEILDGINQKTLDALSDLCNKVIPMEERSPVESDDGTIYYSIPHDEIDRDATLIGENLCVVGIIDTKRVSEKLEDGTILYRYGIITGETGQANIGPVTYIDYYCYSTDEFNLDEAVVVLGTIYDSDLISVELRNCLMGYFE